MADLEGIEPLTPKPRPVRRVNGPIVAHDPQPRPLPDANELSRRRRSSPLPEASPFWKARRFDDFLDAANPE